MKLRLESLMTNLYAALVLALACTANADIVTGRVVGVRC